MTVKGPQGGGAGSAAGGPGFGARPSVAAGPGLPTVAGSLLPEPGLSAWAGLPLTAGTERPEGMMRPTREVGTVTSAWGHVTVQRSAEPLRAGPAPPTETTSPDPDAHPAPDALAPADSHTGEASHDDPDTLRVTELLGRPPMGAFEVVVREAEGDPVVIRNAPLLYDGTPMPTRYWLVSSDLRRRVDRLEAAGGVRRAEEEVPAALVAGAHRLAALERDAALPEGWDGPRPSGGVGGTRQGVKCLHAHLAWHLAGGDDPVGRWTAEHISGAPPETGRP